MVSALKVAESIDPYQKDAPVGAVVRAVDALDWKPGQNIDIRPRLLDKSTNLSRLVDSGSQISVTQEASGRQNRRVLEVGSSQWK